MCCCQHQMCTGKKESVQRTQQWPLKLNLAPTARQRRHCNPATVCCCCYTYWTFRFPLMYLCYLVSCFFVSSTFSFTITCRKKKNCQHHCFKPTLGMFSLSQRRPINCNIVNVKLISPWNKWTLTGKNQGTKKTAYCKSERDSLI